MNEGINRLKTEIYEIETALAQQQFLMEIIRDFGEYNSEGSDGVDKMTYMMNILYKKQILLRKRLDNFIPQFQKVIRRLM